MKRAESSSLHILLLGAALFFVALGLSTASGRNPSLARVGVLFLEEIFYPFRQGANSSFQSISEIWTSYIGVRSEAARAKVLDSQKAKWETELRELQSVAQENRQLRSLLDMREREQLQGVVASVIGWEPSAWLRSVTIDKGRRDGVEVGEAVIVNGAVLGQVMSTALRSSRVLLLVDAGSGIAVRVESADEGPRGVVMGRGKDLCVLQYVGSSERVAKGDRVVTSGLDGVFPRGLEVGRIVHAKREENSLFYTISLQPSVKFDQVTDVFVVQNASGKSINKPREVPSATKDPGAAAQSNAQSTTKPKAIEVKR